MRTPLFTRCPRAPLAAAPTLREILSRPCSLVPLTVTPLGERATGARVVTSPTSGLVVGVAPIDEIAALTALPHFGEGGAYTFLSHGTVDVPAMALRPGETVDLTRRIAEHLAFPPCTVEHVLLVGSADPIFSPLGKDGVLVLQWLLHGMAVEAGRALVHGAVPQRPPLLAHDPERVARYAMDLRPMVLAAGTHAFEPCGAVVRPVVIGPADEAEVFRAVQRGYATDLPPGLTERPGARLYELAWRGLTALATVVGRWTVLHAGSTVDPTHHGGVQGCIRDKRLHMLAHGVLQRSPGGLLRFTRDTAVPSLVNGVRVVTGTNEREHHWQPAA